MKPRPYLPSIDSDAKAAFLNGWITGLAVGFINGLGAAIVLWKTL